MKYLIFVLLAACSAQEIPGTQVAFRVTAVDPFELPTPNDLQRSERGGFLYSGYSNPNANPIVATLMATADDRAERTVLPVAYFRFDAKIKAPEGVQREDADVALFDIERKKFLPVVAEALEADDYTPPNVLAVAAAPGIVLEPNHPYAFIVKRSLKDAAGKKLGAPKAFRELLYGQGPKMAKDVYMPFAFVYPGDKDELAAAAVFTTGDAVAELQGLARKVSEKLDVQIRDLSPDPDDGDHADFCEIVARVKYPQFQSGKPPFNSGGVISLDEEGMPIQTGELDVPAVLSIPKTPMPEGGYPLLLFFHGSGGLTNEVIDRGKMPMKDVDPPKGSGPAGVLASRGIATAGSALPINPERLVGAGDYDYLNLLNLRAFRDTFRQGIFEQTMFLDALLSLEIPPETLGSCAGPSLPAGATAYRFRPNVVAMGQSMGGMYANMFSSIDPRVGTVVATGAGGFWSFMILRTQIINAPREQLRFALGTDVTLSHLHPVMYLLQQAFEQADPIAFVPRITKRRLNDAPVRHVYEPVGYNDKYFAPELFDAMALAYGHKQAGEQVWTSMQDSLSLAGLDGEDSYPVSDNLKTQFGEPYTGVVVQFSGDGIQDPHNVAYQIDDSKYQWRCFVADYFAGRTPVVRAPLPLSSECSP